MLYRISLSNSVIAGSLACSCQKFLYAAVVYMVTLGIDADKPLEASIGILLSLSLSTVKD